MAKALLRVTLTYFFNGCSGQSSAIKIFQGRKKKINEKKKREREEDQVHTNQSKCFWMLSLGLLGIPTCLLPTHLLPGTLFSLVLTCTVQMPACLALLPIRYQWQRVKEAGKRGGRPQLSSCPRTLNLTGWVKPSLMNLWIYSNLEKRKKPFICCERQCFKEHCQQVTTISHRCRVLMSGRQDPVLGLYICLWPLRCAAHPNLFSSKQMA